MFVIPGFLRFDVLTNDFRKNVPCVDDVLQWFSTWTSLQKKDAGTDLEATRRRSRGGSLNHWTNLYHEYMFLLNILHMCDVMWVDLLIHGY